MKLQCNVTIKRWIVIGLSVLVLAFSTGCDRSTRNCRAKRQSTTSSRKVKNIRISARKGQGKSNYAIITINPNRAGTAMKNYFIAAKVITGQGQLLGASEKVRNELQYKVQLEDRSLADLWPSQGDVAQFRDGKSIGFRCKYEPQAGAKEGDMHQLAITVIQKDEGGRAIREGQVKLTLSISRSAGESDNPKQLQLSAREVAGQRNYALITINPNCAGTVMENYFIAAKVITGQGQLLGASEKVRNELQYKVQLEDRSLADLWPSQGDVAQFRDGKSIGFRCKYEPQAGAKEGDMHQLAITVIQKDEGGRAIRGGQVELALSVKQAINE